MKEVIEPPAASVRYLRAIPPIRIGHWSFADKYAGSLNAVLLLSGFFGIAMGIASATWQASIEFAQTLLGIVNIDPTSVGYATHISLFSLLNYVTAGLLAVSNSEVFASVAVCALIGMVAMQAVAMTVFLAFRNAYAAVIGSVATAMLHLYGFGIAYPIILMGSPAALGRIGFFFALFALLLLAFERWRAGLFLCGLSLAVHPSWGLWIGACLLITLLIRFKAFRPIFTRYVGWYLLGALLSATLFVWHKMNYPLPAALPGADPDAAKQIVENYIRYWDGHRQRFSSAWHLSRELTYVAISTGISIWALRTKTRSRGETAFFSILAVSSVLSLIFVFIPSWFDPALFPGSFVALMPGRFVALSIFVALPLVLGYFLRERMTLRSIGVAGALWLGFAVFVWRVPGGLPIGPRQMGLLLAAGTVFLLGKRYTSLAAETASPSPLNSWLFLGTFALGLYFLAQPVLAIPALRERFTGIRPPAGFTGTVLTTIEKAMYQAEARVVTITPLLDGFIYAGGPTVLEFDRIARGIYGTTLSSPPPKGVARHTGVIPTNAYEQLWRARSCSEWAKLAQRFGFQMIMVPDGIQLQLPRVAHEKGWAFYSPHCT